MTRSRTSRRRGSVGSRSQPRLAALMVIGLVMAECTPEVATAQQGPASRRAHVPWTLIDAVGYGGAGFGLGFAGSLATPSEGLAPNLAPIALGTLFGMGAGIAIGHVTNTRARDGRPIGGGLRTATLAGSVLAGATLGALAAVPLIGGSNESGTALGSDGQTFAITTGAGAALGTAFAMRFRSSLDASPVALMPTYDPRGRIGVQVALRF